MPWTKTKSVLSDLKSLLKCGICQGFLQRPCTLGKCEHFFCGACIQDSSTCPLCGVPSHQKDLLISRQLEAATSSTLHLQSLFVKWTELKQDHLVRDGSKMIEILKPSSLNSEKQPPSSKGDYDFEVLKLAEKDCVSDAEDHILSPSVRKSKRANVVVRKQATEQNLGSLENTIAWRKETTMLWVCKSSLSLDDAGDLMLKEDKSTIHQSLNDHISCNNSSEIEPVDENKDISAGPRSKRSLVKNQSKSNGYSQIDARNQKPVSAPLQSPQPLGTKTPKSGKTNGRSCVTASRRDASSTPTSLKCSVRRRSNVRITLQSPASAKLLGSSPLVMKRNAKGETSLHLAAIKGNLNVLKSVLENGFNPDVKDNAGWTPLHEACNRGFVDVAAMLLDYCATIDMPGGDNETPLHDAVYNGHVECVKLLVSRGASVTARDCHGNTPLDIARTDVMIDALKVPVIDICNDLMKAHVIHTPSRAAIGDAVVEKIVIMTSGLESKDKLLVKEWVRELGWTVHDKYSSQVTHLIVPTDAYGGCRRTIKFLQAVVSGLWVVNLKWLMQCSKSSAKVCEDIYEVKGTTASPINMAPARSRMNHLKQLPGLFDGCRFYFHGEFGEHPIPSRVELIQLVRLGGGVVQSREPKLEAYNPVEITVPYHADPKSTLANCSFFIVSSTEKGMNFFGKERRICRLTHSWILACIAEFKLVDKLPAA